MESNECELVFSELGGRTTFVEATECYLSVRDLVLSGTCGRFCHYNALCSSGVWYSAPSRIVLHTSVKTIELCSVFDRITLCCEHRRSNQVFIYIGATAQARQSASDTQIGNATPV